MSNLSRQLSQQFQQPRRHTGQPRQGIDFPVKNLDPKSNKTFSTKWTRDGFVRSLRGDLRIGLCLFSEDKNLGRRWSAWMTQTLRMQMLLTIEEVAKDHLKVSRATVYRLIRRGELRASKVLGCTRIDPQELARFEQMIAGAR